MPVIFDYTVYLRLCCYRSGSYDIDNGRITFSFPHCLCIDHQLLTGSEGYVVPQIYSELVAWVVIHSTNYSSIFTGYRDFTGIVLHCTSDNLGVLIYHTGYNRNIGLRPFHYINLKPFTGPTAAAIQGNKQFFLVFQEQPRIIII
ncbi:hypothetical protein D3C73_1003170 [compost metagenome]